MSVLNPTVETWDGANRRIYLKQGVVNYYPIEDIYHEYRNARRIDEELRKYEPLLRAEGNVPKGAGAYTPRYVVLLNGTKIIPYNESAQLNQLGDMITDNPDVDPTLYDISQLTVAKPIFIKPSEAETIQLNSESIVYSSFQGSVWVDSGSIYNTPGSASLPNGNRERPVNTMALAVSIAFTRGFKSIGLLSNYTLDSITNIEGFEVFGSSSSNTSLDILDSALTQKAVFRNLTLSGVLDGGSEVYDCIINELFYFNGQIHHCMINGPITLGGGATAHIHGCFSGVPGVNTPTIDMGGSGNSLALREYSGGIRLINKTGIDAVSIDLSSGQILLGNDVTNGIIVCRGVGRITENLSSGATIIDQLVNEINITAGVWNAPIANYSLEGSTGKSLSTASSGGVDLQLLANAVWDEPLSTHQDNGSTGKALKFSSVSTIRDPLARGGSINTIIFDEEASTDTDAYNNSLVVINAGTGSGQVRTIVSYDGISKTAYLSMNWVVIPDTTSEFSIIADSGSLTIVSGRVQSSTDSTVTLLPVSVMTDIDEVYDECLILISSGNNAGQVRRITGYDSLTQTIFIQKPWSSNPNLNDTYQILPSASVRVNEIQESASGTIANAVWDEPKENHTTPDTMGSELQTIMDVQAGNWEIQETMMIFYKRDGTELFRYSLLDQNGMPSNKDVFKRLKL